MRWLLNSAVIAAGAYGTYAYEPATIDDLRKLVAGEYISRVGYEETARVIEGWTGHKPVLSRETSVLEPGDDAIVVRLRYRVDPSRKGRCGPETNAWEIAHIMRRS